MDGLRNLAFVVGVLTFAAFGEKAVDTIVVDPVLQAYDSFPVMKTAGKFFVDTVVDSAPERANSGLIGFVHTRYNHPTAVLCRPLPAVAVGRSLKDFLAKNGHGAADKDTETAVLRITVLEFGLKETPHFFYQAIVANVRLKIDLLDPHTGQITKSFSIDSQRSRDVFESGRNSGGLIRYAVANALAEVVRSLKDI